MKIQNLRNPGGIYLKTACLVAVVRTQALARTYCLNSKMELFTLESPEVQTAAVAFANTQYSAGYIWTAGTNGTDCMSLNRKSGLTMFTPTTTSCSQGCYYFCGYKSELIKVLTDQ
jgi:hypothetical protein